MRLLRDPLFHFILLGAALFGAYAMLSGLLATDQSRRIEITVSEIEFLAGNFERQWGRPPTDDELSALVDARVREEVLYREAVAVGLDRNDIVVRRRMVQKMELVSQDLALLADPTDDELRSYFQENSEKYRIPPRISFSHVYFDADRRGPEAAEYARQVLAELREQGSPPARAPQRGDRFLLPHDYTLNTPFDVRRSFGSRFAEELFRLAPGWHGPLVSGYGLHLVYVGERVEGALPRYEDVRDKLVVDYNRVRRERANELLYAKLAERYEIVVDQEALRRDALSSAPASDGP
jgi:hypothetical protein